MQVCSRFSTSAAMRRATGDSGRRIRLLLKEFPVVALLGARQVGKSTLARQLVASRRGPTMWFDLENPADLARLADPGLELRPLRGLVVLDEIQRLPEVFPLLRVLSDRPRTPARFLVLGSASPELLHTSDAEATCASGARFHRANASRKPIAPSTSDRASPRTRGTPPSGPRCRRAGRRWGTAVCQRDRVCRWRAGSPPRAPPP